MLWPTPEHCLLACLVEASEQKYFHMFMTGFLRFTTNAYISISNSSFTVPLHAST